MVRPHSFDVPLIGPLFIGGVLLGPELNAWIAGSVFEPVQWGSGTAPRQAGTCSSRRTLPATDVVLSDLLSVITYVCEPSVRGRAFPADSAPGGSLNGFIGMRS
jgi:hypothetical protein